MENTQERRFRDVLAQVSKGVKSGSADVMRELGVHLGQNFLLEELWKEDRLTLGELARRMRVEVPTVTRMTKRMETAGLLTRVTDDRDRRMVRIALTDAGMALHDRLPAVLDDVARHALHGLTYEQREALIQLLTQVAENVTGPCRPCRATTHPPRP